jgi:hypothetical protein
MGFIWFWIVAVMLVAYVVLDGFDLGVGMLHLFLARTERRTSTRAAQHRTRVGRQRSLAAGRWRHALLRISPRLCVRHSADFISRSDDRALAADHAGQSAWN